MFARLCILLLAIALVCAAPAQAAEAPILNISVDHGTPLSLSAPAASVFIANPEVADVQVMSPMQIMVFGKKTGETTLMATDAGGHTLLHRTIVVSQDLTDLRRELAAAIPGNKIQAESVPDGVILTGETRDPVAVEDARKIASRYVSKDGVIINRIQVAGSNQVMIRVRFAEMSRTVDKEFGINWGTITSAGGFVFGLASGAPLSALASSGGSAALSTLNGESVGAASSPTDGIGLSHQGGRWNVNGLLDALASDGLVTMLAEPNLTAMSGETANFLAGGQVPIVTPQSNGSVSIQYISYGISLEFTPTLVGTNRINLHVKPEVSEPSSVGAVTLSTGTVTAFTTRRAETTVELASGQSFAIAGLLDNSQDQSIDKFPFLGDLPVLGPLFRSSNFQNGQSELVIVITPYVVQPSPGPQALALPMDGYSPPTDSEMLLGMRNSSGDPSARPMSGKPAAVAAPIAKSEAEAPQPAPVAPVAAAPESTPNNLHTDPQAEQTADEGSALPADTPPALSNKPVPAALPKSDSNSSSNSNGFILE